MNMMSLEYFYHTKKKRIVSGVLFGVLFLIILDISFFLLHEVKLGILPPTKNDLESAQGVLSNIKGLKKSEKLKSIQFSLKGYDEKFIYANSEVSFVEFIENLSIKSNLYILSYKDSHWNQVMYVEIDGKTIATYSEIIDLNRP